MLVSCCQPIFFALFVKNNFVSASGFQIFFQNEPQFEPFGIVDWIQKGLSFGRKYISSQINPMSI